MHNNEDPKNLFDDNNDIIVKLEEYKRLLLDSKENFSYFSDFIPAAIFIIQENKFIYTNKYFELLSGLSKKQINKKDFRELIHPDHLELVKEKNKARLESQVDINRFEFKITNPEQEEIWVDFSSIFIEFNKKPAFIGLAIDIDKNKKQEAELILAKEKVEKADKLKTTFLANISHEIRTPMNSIVGYSNLLTKPNLTKEKIQGYTNNIQTSTKQLLELLNDITDLSKIHVNNIEIDITRININELLKGILAKFETYIVRRNKEITINLKLPRNSNEIDIFTDTFRLNQIFSTLITNAIKFTSNGKVEFGYNIVDEDFIFYVKDTGIGIKPDSINKIFDRFFQIEMSKTTNYYGTGLGLTICKSYVEILGGEINVKSKENKGAEFIFSIPIGKTNINKQKISYEKAWKNKNILIVEDEKINFVMIKEFLSHTGVNIFNADTGEKAIKLFEKTNKFDLILMDILLPDINGIEVTKRIKDINPKIPIIMQTAHHYKEIASINVGADAFISKPIDFEKLQILINKYIWDE